MLELDREELAWAAGFFDGEGCTTIRTNRNTKTMALVVSQVEKEPLERFRRAVGGLGKVYGPIERNCNNQKPIHQWAAANFQDVQATICFLWNFLCEPKKEQIIKCYHQLNEFWEEFGSRARKANL